MMCQKCGSTANKSGLSRGLQRYRCKSCKYRFTEGSDWLDTADKYFVTVVKPGNRIVFGEKLYRDLTGIQHGVALIKIDSDWFLQPDSDGIKPYFKSRRSEIHNAFLAKTIRQHFGFDRSQTAHVFGSLKNNKFKMEYFNIKNIPVSNHSGKEPKLRVSKFDRITILRAAQFLMQLEKGDRLTIAKEGKTIFILPTDDKEGFNLTFDRMGNCSVSSQKPGIYFREHFKVERETAFSLLLEQTEREGKTMFKVTLVDSD